MKVKGCASRPRQHFKRRLRGFYYLLPGPTLDFHLASQELAAKGSLLEGISSRFSREATNHVSSRFLREATGQGWFLTGGLGLGVGVGSISFGLWFLVYGFRLCCHL